MTVQSVIAALAAGALLTLLVQRARFSALARSTGGEPSRRLRPQREILEGLLRRSREAEAAAGTAEAQLLRLRTGIDELAVGVVLCDPDGTELLRNRRAVDLAVARHGEALVAKAVDELLADACRGTAGSRLVELTQSRHAYSVVAMPLPSPAASRPNDGAGSGGTASDDGSDLSGSGGAGSTGRKRLLGALAVVRDITEQLRVDRMRRDFVANVSHELKTPVGALALLVEALISDAAIAGSPLVERIENQIERVTRTIDDLMMLSYLEEDSDHVDSRADLTMVVAGAIERIAEPAEQRGVKVLVGDRAPASCSGPAADRSQPAEGQPPAVVRGSTVQLESAVFNLLDNAVKYSEPGGTVDVSVIADGDRVGVSVQDQGIGIPEPEQDRIFERFYRVDSARSRDTGGTGLGLSMVRHVVINHGGDVEVSSREGSGSVFVIRFPRSEQASGDDESDRS